MRLKETNWDAPGGAAEVEVEYPDAPIIDLVNWLRKTSAWLENPELVERRVRRLNAILADHRTAVANGKVVAQNVTLVPLEERITDPLFRAEVERVLKAYRADQAKANRVASLARARNAKRVKRAVSV